ncbi:MAG TPA: ferrochelatase [Kiritimatiellia bacterium]|nr:ferrochelatase [Kiritimatiellia bacterium]
MSNPYDAVLIMSFGGPEGMDDVMPFLDNVLRGRNVPEERKKEVVHHYELFDGVSPINRQNNALHAALVAELKKHGIEMPVYLGNRNWKPFVTDVVREMKDQGVKKFLAFVTSGFSCYSGCRQYREDMIRACENIGADAPSFDKIRVYYNHPDFIAVTAENWLSARIKLPESRQPYIHTAFTAHSIPMAMADRCAYAAQLQNACELTAAEAGIKNWQLVYQSRSGPRHQPWLAPDICDHIRDLHAQGVRELIIHPIGFISDHMEVLYDLDHEARELCDELGITMSRAATPGIHPRFISMIAELIRERMDPKHPKRAIGDRGPNHDVCPANCCQSGREAMAAGQHQKT